AIKGDHLVRFVAQRAQTLDSTKDGRATQPHHHHHLQSFLTWSRGRTYMETMVANGGGEGRAAARYGDREQQGAGCGGARRFQMPLHYPRYTRANYEAMPEWQLDRLLSDYGLPVHGNVHQKRSFAMGAFLWGAGN
uniref:DUF7722 domain-containing protein n=3 Tax=Triticinae TaxID=1648030 RepID=A0A453EG85_AEGTS